MIVDINTKNDSDRRAVARGKIFVNKDVINAIENKSSPKGDILYLAKLSGASGAKYASTIIQLCHPLLLTSVDIDVKVDECEGSIVVTAVCELNGKTGPEMEALSAVSIALLNIYDSCKSLDKLMEIGNINLLEKTGGKSGYWVREDVIN